MLPEAIPNSVVPEIHIFAEFLNVGAASDGKAIDGFGITDCLGVSRTVSKSPTTAVKKNEGAGLHTRPIRERYPRWARWPANPGRLGRYLSHMGKLIVLGLWSTVPVNERKKINLCHASFELLAGL